MSIVAFLDRLGRLPRALLVLLGTLAVLLVGALDYASGYEFGCSVFYLVPVLLVGWTVDRKAGLSISLLAASVWLLADLTSAHRYSHALLPYWNGAVRLAIFTVTVLLLAGFKDQRALARTDLLTGLPNRFVLLEVAGMEIERARRHARPLTFAYIDCDGFKTVNDRLGHTEGDALLRLVAGGLRASLRRFDSVARIGGDEFAVLLPETGATAATTVLRKLQSKVHQSITRWSSTISIGAVTFLEPPASTDEMVRLADALMYEAKREGKGSLKTRVVESPGGATGGGHGAGGEAAEPEEH